MKKLIPFALLFFMLMDAQAQKNTGKNSFPKFDTEAHRGGRGLMPENTIAAMKNAVDIGVTTLEMDLHITRDKKVVVSHDASFNPLITTTPEGKPLDPKEPKRFLYAMDYDSITRYDVGLKPFAAFPKQKKVAAKKPLLNDLIDELKAYSASKKRMMWYNMEIKSSPKGDKIEHPEPEKFVDLVIKLLRNKKLLERTVIQSFDVRPLQIIHKKYPEVKLSFLVAPKAEQVAKQLDTLGFIPFIYSPEFKTVNTEMVKTCHEKGIKVVPWTVNDIKEVERLKKLKVDGIISDYPDLLVK